MGRTSDPQALAAALQQQQAMQQQAMPQRPPQFGKGGSVPTVQAGQSAQQVMGAPQQAQPQNGKMSFGGRMQGQRMGSPEAAAAQQMAMQQARSGQAQGPFSGVGKGNRPPPPQV